ncbi:hypothetical protein V5799_033791 [Amblyomma americanum]|uniref:Uncharacterized protein n=1 Tax=Amblyomma americanum TaxID=6943 RepID=A0AAQ4DMA5_AMBAM
MLTVCKVRHFRNGAVFVVAPAEVGNFDFARVCEKGGPLIKSGPASGTENDVQKLYFLENYENLPGHPPMVSTDAKGRIKKRYSWICVFWFPCT